MKDSIEPIRVFVAPHSIDVEIVDEAGNPVKNFKGELWVNYGKRFYEDMPNGKCRWEFGTTDTLFW
ncbi:MAG: hypothetical protein AAGF67_01885, partial [Verrucomicrobiota bacterium]